MHFNYLSCEATQPTAAMIRISTGLRNLNVRAVVNNLLVKQVPSLSSLSSADYYSSAIALRERKENSSFGDRNRNPTYTSPARAPLLDVSAGGGPRPKKPRVWKTKSKRGSIGKSVKLIDLVNKISNTKEEVYGALDAWIAWDLEFPLIAVKKALKTLKDQEEWRRIIQVSKWMLDKGQGKTLATYQLLLEAFDHEGRIEEAELLWAKVLRDNQQCIPRTMFAQVIAMYDRHDKKKELLKVFADMEELQVKPDPGTVEKVARAYSHFGYHEVGQAVLERQTELNTEFRYSKGKRVEVKSQPVLRGKEDGVELKERPGLQINSESQKRSATEISRKLKESLRLDPSYEQEEGVGTSGELREKPKLETSNNLEDSPRSVTDATKEARPTLEISSELEDRLNFDTSISQERSNFETNTEVKDRDPRPSLR